MPRKKLSPKRNAVIDYETDPFKYGRIPRPFVAGFYDGETYKQFWGDTCVLELVDWLKDQKTPYRIYAHNGGKFDFFLMLEHLENPVKIINGRIVKAKFGIHELRDSYAIIPIKLEDYKKDEIDYKIFEREVREQNRDAICHYLRKDCEYLMELVEAFWGRFGDKLTIGSTAIGKLREYHPFDSQGMSHDSTFRPFYFGGRVQAFETGVLKGDWKVYDVNSMYPYVMAHYDHPTGNRYTVSYASVMDKRGNVSNINGAPMFFAVIECQQQGAFPTRVKDGPLNFDVPEGEFFVTSHELKAAVAAGRVQNVKVRKVFAPHKVIRFADYVSVYMAEKVRAKQEKDKVAEIFAKLLLNSAYGKFGQSPEHYKDYYLQTPDLPPPDDPYEISAIHDGGICVWQKPSVSQRFFDVATAASVTGAARSVLLTALANSTRVVYCDTDSIICERTSVSLDPSRLGAWKLEASGDTISIAGKKLYALQSRREFVKVAAKGVRFSGTQVRSIAEGSSVEWFNDAPSFSVKRPAAFVRRKVSRT